MPFFKKSLAGPGYVILNAIRVMNIMSLMAVITASVVMLVKTFVVSKFFFFDGVTHVIEAGVALFLIISELPLFRNWFITHWPLLGQNHGFVALGGTMMALGNGLLAYLNKPSTSQQSLGLAFWRIVISAGIVVIVMGVVNLFASYIFRDSAANVSARQVRTYGAMAPVKAQEIMVKTSPSLKLSHRDSLPSYYSRATTPKNPPPERRLSEPRSTPARLPLTTSRPINNDTEQFAKFSTSPDVQEPNLAHHPAMYSNRI